jgi:hypothetical protein
MEPASGPLRGTAGKKVTAFFCKVIRRGGRPFGGGGVHRNCKRLIGITLGIEKKGKNLWILQSLDKRATRDNANQFAFVYDRD